MFKHIMTAEGSHSRPNPFTDVPSQAGTDTTPVQTERTVYEITDLPVRGHPEYRRGLRIDTEDDAFLSQRGVGTYVDHPGANDPHVRLARHQSTGVVKDGINDRDHFEHPVRDENDARLEWAKGRQREPGLSVGGMALAAALGAKRSVGSMSSNLTLKEPNHLRPLSDSGVRHRSGSRMPIGYV